jgi:hypothetical protein
MMRWDIINAFIQKFQYESYLEIGAQNTITGNFPKIIAKNKVSVDPNPPEHIDFKGTSDEYFAQLNLNDKFDIIFIDGLHHSEQVLIDIENSLNHLSKNGTIICHDCLPYTEQMQLRDEQLGKEWTGDVWKAIAKLNTSRTDLMIKVINTDYGCGIIRNGNNIPYIPTITEYLNYEYYVKHKDELLNVLPVEKFFSFLMEL